MSGRPISDVRIWSVQDRRSNERYARPWIVRWSVEDKVHQRPHRTRAEADHYRSLLLVAQREGEPFDRESGEPNSWSRTDAEMPLLEWVRRWLGESWDDWQPRTRKSAIEAVARFVPLSSSPDPDDWPAGLRSYLTKALVPGAELELAYEEWLNRNCPALVDLDRSLLAQVDAALGLGDDGQPLAATTANRLRTVSRSCIRRAVDLQILDSDPWPPAPRGANKRKSRRGSKQVDVKALPDPETMRAALKAIETHQPGSRTYQAMTSVMYYSGLRPSEVVMLRPRHLHLPLEGWGRIDVLEADISFDVSGPPKTGERSVPIPPVLVKLLASWAAEHQTAPEDLLFRTTQGNRPSFSNWGRAWHRALKSVGQSPLRLYDCRHAAATTWLNAGVPLGEVARRLGHSVEVLVSTYVGALRGDEAAANEMIDQYLGDVA